MSDQREKIKGIGLVFAGGGGKGSYEIGVWKYLHEQGLDQYIRCISGTSVGALNAALFVGNSYELTERIWMDINQSKILTPKKITFKDIMRWLISMGMSRKLPMSYLGKAGINSFFYGRNEWTNKIVQGILRKTRKDYMFSREGLMEIISEGLNFNMIRSSEIPCWVTCVRCPGLKVERFLLNEYSDEEITKILLASSAIPLVFPNEEFHGKKYCDGGIPIIGDNIPVSPVYDSGVENIIVVHLNREEVIDKEMFPDTTIIEIVPREDLGTALTGTMDFSPEGVERRIQLGYEDTKKIMQPFVDMILMTVENQRLLKVVQQNNFEFEKKRQSLLEKNLEMKQRMKKDGFEEIYRKLTRGK